MTISTEERGINSWNNIRNHANDAYDVELLNKIKNKIPKISLCPIVPPNKRR